MSALIMRALSLSLPFIVCAAGCSGGGTNDAGTAGGGATTAGGSGTAGGSATAGGNGTAGGSGTAGGMGTAGGAATGSCGWERNLTSPLGDVAHDVLALPDQSVVVVGIVGPVADAGLAAGGFAVRFDAQGTLMWSRSYGPNLTVKRVEAAANGDLLLAGVARSNGDCTNFHGAEDVWIARVSASDGQEQFKTCVGGDDDEEAFDLREVMLPSGPALHLTGQTDSHSNGDVGPKHGGGGFNAPDVMSAFVSYADGGRVVTASCHGTNGPDVGRGFLDDGNIMGSTFGANDGDLADSGVQIGFADLLLTRFRTPPCAAQTCPVDAVRIGGEGNDSVTTTLPGNLVVGVTRSSDGGVQCPGATQTTPQAFVAHVGAGIDEMVCLTNSGSATVNDAFLADGKVWLAGWGWRRDGFFADAGVAGSGPPNDYYVIAVDATDRHLVRRVVNANVGIINGAALRPDGCLVVVGSASSSARVTTIAP